MVSGGVWCVVGGEGLLAHPPTKGGSARTVRVRLSGGRDCCGPSNMLHSDILYDSPVGRIAQQLDIYRRKISFQQLSMPVNE